MTSNLARGQQLTVRQVAQMIDHSLLRPELTPQDVTAGCALATERQVASVCVKPSDVPQAVKELSSTKVAVGTVIGFPHGATTTAMKVAESLEALGAGATELDMVLNIGWLRGGDTQGVHADIRAVVEAAQDVGALVKVILENAYLIDSEKVTACRISEEAGADFVKTSTGFASTGATVADIALMRASIGPSVQVKAAGGVRTLDLLLAMVAEGATRFGATATAEILDEAAQRQTDERLVVPSPAGP